MRVEGLIKFLNETLPRLYIPPPHPIHIQYPLYLATFLRAFFFNLIIILYISMSCYVEMNGC